MGFPRSFSNLLSNNATYGNLTRFVASAELAAVPAATTTSGYISAHRCKTPFTVPSFSGPTEAYLTYCDMTYGASNHVLLMALEYDLGNINMSTGTFTQNLTMPSKTIEGASIQTASMLTLATVTSAVTATTPGLTITYTNQSGTGGQSASMTLPTNTNTLNTAYLMTPHLASGDTGVRAITACTKSAGSAGTINFYGLLPLAFGTTSTGMASGTSSPLTTPFPNFPIAAADTISWWIFDSTIGADFFCGFSLEAGS